MGRKKIKLSAELSKRRQEFGRLSQRMWFVTVFVSAFSVAYCSHKEKSMDPMFNVQADRKVGPKAEIEDNLPYLDMKSAFFDFDKSILRNDGKKALMPTVEWLKKNPKIRLQVEGYCDERGSEGYNLKLGERRATAVKHFMAQQGIDSDRITALSYGKVEGGSNKERTENRRVGLVVIYGGETAKLGE